MRQIDEMAQKKGVTLTLFVDPAIPGHVEGDALRLRQVLTNLLNNAIKFSSGQPRPGRVSVRAVLVKNDARECWVEIDVTDNGIGMDGKARANLFKAFSQADASTTRRFGGTGLGLAIVDRLVKLMGGKITVQSVPGKGSSFRVRLPFGAVPAEVDGKALASEVAGLSCVVVGKAGGLADDLATYLADAQAHVERVPDLAGARQWQAGRNDLSVWIVDADQQSTPTGQLQAADRIEQGVQFVVLLVERGKRRRARAVGSNTIMIDGNALNRRTFLRAVAAAAGRASLEVEAIDPVPGKGVVIAPSREQALRERRLVLVAEDNETNRKVIAHQLALLGYAADVAPDGREAWRLWSSGEYALLLTDLHMPHMDGYELARAVRSTEVPGAHFPIIALTANALKGEDQRCRASGMDDYLSKPVSLLKLKAALDRWLQAGEAADAMVVPAEGPALSGQCVTPRSLDVDVLRALVGDDPRVVNDFLIDFRDGAVSLAAELRAACAASQPSRAADTAHKLKSTARAVGALALAELCETIESEGKAGNADTLAALLPRFDAELAAVENSIDIVATTPRGSRGDHRDPSDIIDKRAARVLIVDDESFMLDLNRRVLANLGFTDIETCESARHALGVIDAADRPVDLILLDLNMPDIDGVQFVRHLVERGYQGSLILVSGEDERMLQAAEKLVQSHLITTLGHLHKPLEPRQLVQLMEHWQPAARSRHAAVPGQAGKRAARKEYTADEVQSAITNGELVNYYQPQVSLTTGKVTGVETLVRWLHPLDGLVFPDQFIGVAEANGLVSDLTRSVIAGSLAQASAYRRQTGVAFPMAINVSMEDLGNLNFADHVAKAAEQAGVPASEVTLEVTESQLMQDLRIPLEVLTRLRMKRFRLSIDDFGTGHSNLSQLRDMPFHELKIDRGFVHGAGANPTLGAIFDASVTLAKQLGLQIVAEGVEDEDDWDIVRRAGCDAAQGYFIARPMPAEQLPEWMASWKQRALVDS